MPTLPQNPFENMFGEGSKTTPKQKINNPFEGIFEAKQTAPEVVPAPKIIEPTLSTAPKGTVITQPKQEDSLLTKAAKIVLPKSMEDFFGLNRTEAYKQSVKKYEESYAAKDLERLQKEIEAGGGQLPKQTAGEVLKTTKAEKYLPFISAIPDIVNSVQIYQSAKRLEKGEETMVDVYRLTKFRAEQERDKTFGAKIASVLTELPSFGGELLLTGGIYTAGKKATEKAILETLEKSIGKTAGRIVAKSAANIVGGTLQTIPARGVEIIAGTIQNMVPDYSFTKDELGKLQPVISGEGDDLLKAAAKSLSNQWVEVVSEHSGGIFTEALTPVKNQLMKIGILKAFLASNPTAKSTDFMKWVNRAGWNGVLAEMGEERIGEAIRGVLTQVGLSEEGWVIPSKEQLAVELVSFSVPGVMIGMANKALQAGSIQDAINGTPTEEEKTKPKPITEAENIVGARDILIVGKGVTNLNTDAMAKLNSTITQYHNQMATPVIEVKGADENNLADIKIVPYPDGKWGYSYEIKTPESGVYSDFLTNRIVNNREEAVALAKEEILKYIKQEIANVSSETKANFEKINKQIGKIEPGLESTEINNLKQEVEILEMMIAEHPAQSLTKFANKRTGELPEVLGVGKSKFGRTGDQIVTELGFPDSEIARASYQELLKFKRQLVERRALLKEKTTPKEEITKKKKEQKTIEEKPEIVEKIVKPKIEEAAKKIKTKGDFNVGDTFDTQGKTNMVSPVKIREITGNTLKFIDAKGTEFAGMARATVRGLVNEGSWKRIISQPITIKEKIKEPTKEANTFFSKLKEGVAEVYKVDEEGEIEDEEKMNKLIDEADVIGKKLGYTIQWNDSFQTFEVSLQNTVKDIFEAQKKFVDIAKFFDFELKTNEDGTITMYHGTSEKNAKAIIAEAFEAGSFFSPSLEEEFGGVNGASFYGDHIVKANIDPRYLVFRTEGEFYVDDQGAISNIQLLGKTPAEAQIKAKEGVLEKKGVRAPSGIASAGRANIGTFEDLSKADITEPDFKLFEEVKKLVEKYAKSIGEDYTPRGALGVYFRGTSNIRIKGMNDVSVAAHEITHFLDFSYKITEQLMVVKGRAANGNPIYESKTAKLRRELSNIYELYYPGAKATHKLEKRLIEGFATLLQKYVEMPTSITAQYPNVVDEFLKPERTVGLLTFKNKFYRPVIGEIIKDLRNLIAKYQGLPALDKIGARVIDDKVNVNKESFLNLWQKFKTEIVDNVYPIEMLAKQSGTHFTKADPSLWVRQYNNSNAIILNNINGNKGFWGWRNGEMKKLHDFNWKDLITDLHQEKIANEFGYWLVARREHFAFEDVKATELAIKAATKARQAAKEAKDAGAVIQFTLKLDELKAKLKTAKEILANDGFTDNEVSEAYSQNKERFEKFAEKYDSLIKEDLNFLNDPTVGLLGKEEYDQLSSKEGYASFKRYFYDELVGEEEKTMARIRFGTAKVSSLLKRTGSQKPIINPLFSALTNHAEITRKGLKQIVSNRIGGVAGSFPDLFQKVELKVIPDAQGRLIYPQEKDNNIIMARLNYKRVPFLTDATIKRTVDEVLNTQSISIFEKLLMGSSRFFTKGTTGLFPGFAITNYTVDQITATAQSFNKYIPLYDPLKKVFEMLDKDKIQHTYLQEYLVMGGERQTFVGWQDMTPNELFDAIGKEREGLLKTMDYINSGMNILAIPSQWSEIMTRATEYIKSREAGKTQIVALEEAGRVTAPFHHIGRFGGGRVGQVYIKSIPFFNPAIQVLAQAAETLETPEGRMRYGFVALAVSASSIAALGLLFAFGSDDQKALYADISPDELNKYIWLPNPNGTSLIKIRVPDQMEVPATLINMMIVDNKFKANYTAGEYINAGMAWLPAQVDISQPAKMLMAWVPQIIKPGVLTLAGVKDFPKIMPLESQMQKSKPAGLRATEGTSPVAKIIGKALNLSPIKIDYLLTGYAGRATGFLTGKPGIYNPLTSMSREYYFTSGRKLQSYYDAKKENDEDYYAYSHKLKTFRVGESSAILKRRAKLKEVGTLVDIYRDLDLDKQKEKADKIRVRILNKIDEL